MNPKTNCSDRNEADHSPLISLYMTKAVPPSSSKQHGIIIAVIITTAVNDRILPRTLRSQPPFPVARLRPRQMYVLGKEYILL